jgi:hypothetical protein
MRAGQVRHRLNARSFLNEELYLIAAEWLGEKDQEAGALVRLCPSQTSIRRLAVGHFGRANCDGGGGAGSRCSESANHRKGSECDCACRAYHRTSLVSSHLSLKLPVLRAAFDSGVNVALKSLPSARRNLNL